MKTLLPISISFFLSLAFLSGQVSTVYMYDGIANNWSGNGIAGTFRNLGTDSWKFTRNATFSGGVFYKVYARSENNDNNFNSPGGMNPSEVWSGTLTVNTQGTAFNYGDGGGSAGSYSATSGKYYTYCWEDKAVGNNATAIVMETSATPVSISSVSQNPVAGNVHQGESVTVSLSLNATPSSEENFFVRYSTNNFATYGALLAPSSGSGTSTQQFTIPSQAQGTTVSYYVLSTTLSSGSINNNSFLTDLASIAFDNNAGSNYSYTVQAPLPVELVAFEATKYSQRLIQLNWLTATETNNSHFDLQRSSDTRTWQTLATLEGAGFSTSQRNYEFIDEKPLPLNFYRLRQVDFDETFSFSKVISIRFEGNSPPPSLSPNPAEQELAIDFEQELEPGFSAQFFDQTGRLALETALQPCKKCLLDVSQLSPGLYFLKINGNHREVIWQDRFVKK